MSALAYGALWVFIFSIPWESLIVLPGVNIITKVTGGLAVGIALLAIVFSGRFRRWHPYHFLALLFWVWAACDLFLWHSGEKLPRKFWTFGQLLLVPWMIWELATTERRIRGLLVAYVLGASVAVADMLLIYRSEASVLRRFAAGEFDPNDLAMIIALAIPMAWYIGLTCRGAILRWVCRGYMPAALVGVGLTGSRGGMIATTVALLIVPLSMTRLSPKRLALAIAMLVLSGALAVAYTPRTLIQRLATTGSEVSGGHLGGRGRLWRAGWEAFAQKPMRGYGTGAFRTAITPMLGDEAQVAHNSFLSVLVEQGIVGFVLYMAMLAAVFRAVLRLPRAERRFALIQLATLGVAMLPLTWEDRKPVWFILPALLGLSQAYLAKGDAVIARRTAYETPPRALRPTPARFQGTAE